jgi:hypothetical protein
MGSTPPGRVSDRVRQRYAGGWGWRLLSAKIGHSGRVVRPDDSHALCWPGAPPSAGGC